MEDNLLAISTSVGQNTPPPSPKHDEDKDSINSDFESLVRHPLLPFDVSPSASGPGTVSMCYRFCFLCEVDVE